jgi:hypothetical protein
MNRSDTELDFYAKLDQRLVELTKSVRVLARLSWPTSVQ